jgi:(4-O-methyl)-D-glucuronate---lignin esterase
MKNIRCFSLSFITSAACLFACAVQGQVADKPDGKVAGIPVNYTEAKVGSYTLPDPLKLNNGQIVKDAKMWNELRRPELLDYYRSQIYGRVPATAPKVFWQVVSNDDHALGGIAVMQKLAGHMGGPDGPAIEVTLYTPAKASKPVPVLVNLSFDFSAFFARMRGRRLAATNAVAPATETAGTNNSARRGAGGGFRGFGGPRRGSPEELITNGFAYATIIYNSIETDVSGQPNVNIVRKLALAPGQTAPTPDEWGAIAAWAWGVSRFVDYLETDQAVDAKRIAITGVSRLGKTVLWAGANDPRIALVIASCSGEGGAALARRNYGETIAHLEAPTRYPYQFAGNYAKYAKDPNTLAVDTHCLIALMAPRPLLLQTGNTDNWSDPKGEFLAEVAARPVYALFGKKGPESDEFPPAGKFVGDTLAYYMHVGGHGTVPSDWDIYLQFLKTNLKPGT